MRRFASNRAYNGGHPSEPQQSCLVREPEEARERSLHAVEDPGDALALAWLIEVEVEPPRRAPPNAAVQGKVVREYRRESGPVLSIYEAVLHLQGREGGGEALRTDLPV